MHRRLAIQKAALLIGGAVAASTLPGVHAGEADPAGTASVLGQHELAVVSRIADLLFPRTDTPGALDAGVPAFIETALREVYSPAARHRYRRGLRDFDAAARRAYGRGFLALDAPRQRAFVRKVQDAAIADERAAAAAAQRRLLARARTAPALERRAAPPAAPRSFILATKELTLRGYFTSRAGAQQVLQYIAIPGAYHACLPVRLAGNGKRWATN